MKHSAKIRVYNSKPSPHEVIVLVFIDIDLERIARDLGEKAYRNRSKKSHGLHGAVKVTEVREVQS